MIGSLRGTLRERATGQVVIDVQGVGYAVEVPMSTFLELPRVGEDVELLVNTQVRAESITLYGFRERRDRDVFERLLTVSGVGPRIALAALSALGPADLVAAVREGDVRRLSGVPGVGKKTAERIIVDLRDRLGSAEEVESVPARTGGEVDDVVSALVNLGYPERAVLKAVRDVQGAAGRSGGKGSGTDDVASFDDLLRQALQRLSRA